MNLTLAIQNAADMAVNLSAPYIASKALEEACIQPVVSAVLEMDSRMAKQVIAQALYASSYPSAVVRFIRMYKEQRN